MKTFRHIALTALITIGAFSAITYTSCSKDDCKDVVCQNGGTCSGGTCTCPTGYSGARCESLWTAAFTGTWTAIESGSTYQVTITPGATNTTLLITNLGDYGCSVGGIITYDGTLGSATTFTVAQQKCGYQMNATGTLTASTITVTYTATYELAGVPVTDNGTITMTK